MTTATLGAVRDKRKPTRQDVGKAPPTAADADNTAKVRDLLLALIPTEVVAPYTAVTAIIVGAIAKPTPQTPNPDEYEDLRWLVFGVMVLTVGAFVWFAKKRKEASGETRFPALEISGAVLAAIAWAFLLPESPLTPYIDDEVRRSLFPPILGFVVVMATLVVAQALKKKANGAN